MKSFRNWFIAGLVLIGIIFLVFNSNAFISKQTWKYRDGFHIGDWVGFDSDDFYLKGNSIIKNDRQIAKIKICLGKLLVIKDSKTGQSGYYINK